MKFKPGDKVMVVKTIFPGDEQRDAYVGTIQEIRKAYVAKDSEEPYMLNCTDFYYFDVSELEHAEIVNTPLYQALK